MLPEFPLSQGKLCWALNSTAGGKQMPCRLAPSSALQEPLWDWRLVAKKERTELGFYRRNLRGFLISRSVDWFVCSSLIWFDFALEHFAQMQFYREVWSVKSTKVKPHFHLEVLQLFILPYLNLWSILFFKKCYLFILIGG